MIDDVGNDHVRIPSRAAVGGRESQHVRSKHIFNRDHDCAIGLHHRLSADALYGVGCVQGWSPGEAAVGGSAHPDQAVGTGIVPFDVAVSEEGAGRGIVTGNPVLVGTPRRGYGDWILPGKRI